MKIAIDARMINMSGIGTYIQNLIKNNCYNVALGNIEDLKKYDNYLDEKIEFNEKIYGIKEQLRFPYKKLKKLKPDVLHIPHYNVPIFYKGKMIVTIHDLTHLVHKEFLPNKLAYYYAKIIMWIAIKKAYKIITVSENSKRDILKYFKVDPNKIEVIYNGISDEFQKKPKEELKYLFEKYNISENKKNILYVGNLKPHKNLERLLDAFSKIKNKDEYNLILVGKAFKNFNKLEKKEEQLNIYKNVIHTGIVSQEELVDFYNLSDLFVFPSLYEGFGLPILEALACGVQVACSNTSSMPEVGGKLVQYFNPYSVDDIKEKIENTNFDNKNSESEIKIWISKFNWKDAANKHKILFQNYK